MTDTDDESKSPSPAVIESETYLTEHLAAHISATRHHLTGYWTSAEKALFFRALSVHSRLRPDLIAASIGTKSTADVAVYLSLLLEGATRTNNGDKASSRSARITIGRDQYPAAHEVSAELVALEDQYATRICVEEPVRAKEVEDETRAEALRTERNRVRVRRGEGEKGRGRDREGQEERREAFQRWRAEREIEWERKDALARLDGMGLQVLDRILRTDEEKRAEASSDDEGEVVERARQRSSARLHPVASSSSPGGDLHATPPPPSSPPATSVPDDDDDDDHDGDDANVNLSNLSPTSRRRIYKRLHMRRARAEAKGDVAQLDLARLKPGRKASATSKYRQPRPRGDGHGANEGENPNSKQPERGNTRPYKIQLEFERLRIGPDYLRTNGLGLFHLGALGRLMRLYPRLDSSRPEGVAESIAMETIQNLHTFVVQFTQDLVRRMITLRELDFALLAHTRVWGLGDRVVRPTHVRRALELSGGVRLSMRIHFERLSGRFSEGEESTEDDDGSDVPLVVRARKRKAKAVVRDENGDEGDDDEDTNIGQHQQQQQTDLSKDEQALEALWQPWSSSHRAIYSPFVYAPDLVAPAHPFGIYAPGTVPEQPGQPSHPRHVTDPDTEDEDEEEEEEEDLMPTETDDEALQVELNAEARLDAADARAAAVYESGVWVELRGAHDSGVPLRKRRRAGSEAEMAGGDDRDAAVPRMVLRTRKRIKHARGEEWPPVVAVEGTEVLRSPDGVKVKSAAMIEDSDSDSEYLG